MTTAELKALRERRTRAPLDEPDVLEAIRRTADALGDIQERAADCTVEAARFQEAATEAAEFSACWFGPCPEPAIHPEPDPGRWSKMCRETVAQALTGGFDSLALDYGYLNATCACTEGDPDDPDVVGEMLEALRQVRLSLNAMEARLRVIYRLRDLGRDKLPGVTGPKGNAKPSRWTAATLAGFLLKSDPLWTESQLAVLFRSMGIANLDNRDAVHDLLRNGPKV